MAADAAADKAAAAASLAANATAAIGTTAIGKIGYSMWIAKGRSRGTRKGAWTSACSTRKGVVWPSLRHACVRGGGRGLL